MKLRNRASAPTIVERGTPLVGAARDLTTHAIDSARPHVTHAAETARDSVLDAAVAARATVVDTVVPAVQVRATRVSDAARDDIAPKVVAAVLAALAASEPVRDEAQARGSAVLAALKGQAVVPPKRRTHRIRTSFGLLALLTAAGAGWAALQRRRAGDPWSVPSTGTSTFPTTTPSSSATAPGGDPLFAEAGAAEGNSPVTGESAEPDSILVMGTVEPIDDVTTDATAETAQTSLLPDGPDEDVKDLR